MKNQLLDVVHKTVTISLAAVTCAGAYTVGEGATYILKRRVASGATATEIQQQQQQPGAEEKATK